MEHEFEIKNKIHELRSYIASNWPGIEERKHLYQRIVVLERSLKELEEKKNAGLIGREGLEPPTSTL